MSVTDLLLKFFLVYISCDSIICNNVASSWSDERLDQMEKMMRDLQSKVSSQDELIRLLQSKASSQDELVLHLKSKESSQDELILHLQSKQSSQDELILYLQSKESKQDSLLHKLQNHVSLLQEQLSQRDAKQRQQQASAQYLNFLHKTRFFLHAKQAVPILKSDQSNLEPENSEQSLLPKSSMTSASHDVRVRGDDGGMLQAVVDGLGQQVTKLGADVQAMSSQIQSLQSNVLDARTSTFVHWGSSQCAAHSQLVYSGVVGGKHYNHIGSGTNLLCLTMSPVLSNHSVPGTSVAYLYGTEYQTGDSEYNSDPVCAVCQSSFSNVIMIPGTTACTSGWSPLYSGYLMAQYYDYPGANEFVCVDSARESLPHSRNDDNGALLYFTITECGSLPCLPYVTQKIVTCVVCGR